LEARGRYGAGTPQPKQGALAMKRLHVVALSLVMGVVLSADGNAPAKKKPAPKKKAVKVVDPKQAAENARFSGTSDHARPAFLALDKLNQKLVDSWVETRDAQEEGSKLDLVWGVKARRDAEKRKILLDKLLPRLNLAFEKLKERQEKRFDRELLKKRKVVAKLLDRPSTSSERLAELQAKELEKARAEVSYYEGLLSAMGSMEQTLSSYEKSRSGKDRLTQLGVTLHDRALRKEIEAYDRTLDVAYDIKDLQTDIATLEARKKEGKAWRSNDEGQLSTANSTLQRTGRKIEGLVERDRKTLNRTIDKMKSDIARLESRLKGVSKNSKSEERYLNEKWELETQLMGAETLDTLLKQLAIWKPEAEKKAAKKPGH
jgi:hypothetical protein